MSTPKPRVFVIMPFSESFEDVYTQFIEPLFEKAGFSVTKASNIENQRNIIQDILEGLHTSDLIVADLSDSNPNVFYELGIAHAWKKPVILLTQDIEEVPFDLKPYRLIEYDTNFARIESARDELAQYARGFLSERTQFGSPVIDYDPASSNDRPTPTMIEGSASSTAISLASNDGAQSNELPDDRGFLDHQVTFTDGYSRIAEILKGSTENLLRLTGSLEETSSDISKLTGGPRDGTQRAAMRLCRQLATKINSFSDDMKKANTEYAEILRDTEDSLEFLITFQFDEHVASKEAEGLASLLPGLEDEAKIARDNFILLSEKMDKMPRMERRLNRAVARGSDEIMAMAKNIDRHIATLSRARQKYLKEPNR